MVERTVNLQRWWTVSGTVHPVSVLQLPSYFVMLHVSIRLRACNENKSRYSPLHYTHDRLTALLSGTTRVSRYQKGKTNLDFTEARDSEWQWHQLGHMQVCTSLQTDNHTSTPPLSFFTCRLPFLPPSQQRQSICITLMLFCLRGVYAI